MLSPAGDQQQIGQARHIVLVVDDDADARMLIVEALRRGAIDTVEATCGEEAIEIARRQDLDAVLLDRVMPGIDGVEVLRCLRADAELSRLPILMLTALNEPHDRAAGFDDGANDYIAKPFDADELVARVCAQIRAHAGWAEAVSLEVERRTALTTVARAAARAGTDVYELADQLCHELLRFPEIDGAELVETIAHGALTLGGAGDRPARRLGAEADQPAHRTVPAHARSGPWIMPAANGDIDQMIAGAPIVVDEITVAVLLVTSVAGLTRSEHDRCLSVAIDFAALTGAVIGPALRDSAARTFAHDRFIELVDGGAFHTIYQPIVDLGANIIVGFEALTRFDGEADTEQAFVNAAAVDAGLHVELRTMEAALRSSDQLPADAWLSLNASPSLVTQSKELPDLLARYDHRRIIIELSELEPVRDYDELQRSVHALGAGVQLSIDDAGSGFSSLAHVLRLHADHVKIDQTWIRDIDSTPPKRALVAGVQNFAIETGAIVVAEGIETEAELDAVRQLGIELGQGYLLGRPAAISPHAAHTG